MKIFAGIVAGGKGTRIKNSKIAKQFIKINGRTIIENTIDKFIGFEKIKKIYLGINKDYMNYMEDIISINGYSNVYIVEGGGDRNETIANIISSIHSEWGKDGNILITHDSVRPFVDRKIIQEHIEKIKHYDVVNTIVKTVDTIVESYEGEEVNRILNREILYNCQTPQSFNTEKFMDIYSKLSVNEKQKFTDACGLFVEKGINVGVVKGDYKNIKITNDFDLDIAKLIFNEKK